MKNLNWKQAIARFLTAQTISLLGSSLVQYAIIWHITLTTSSGSMLTISTLCGFLPQICISIFAGVWLDRYDRKKMIMISDSIIAVATLLLAIAFFTGRDSLWLLFAVLAVRSAGTGIQTPAVNAIIPQLVPKEGLLKINGINSTLASCMMFLTPALSGALLSVTSLEVILLIDVTTAVIGVSITGTIPIKPYKKAEDQAVSVIQECKEGFLYLKENKFLKYIFVFQLVILFCISPSAFLTPLMVSRSFGAEVWRLTAGEMTYSLGMVFGGLLVSFWGGKISKMQTVIFAAGAYGVLMIGLGVSPVFLVYLFCNMLIGITAPCYNAPITTALQQRVALPMQGRVFGFMQIATSCALPLGMVFFGPLADRMAVQWILIGGGCAVLLAVFFVWRSKILPK